MGVLSHITDSATGVEAKISRYGQLVTGAISYNSVANTELDSTGTAFNMVTPREGKRIVIDALILFANRNVGVNDATVEIYCSDVGPEETTASTEILTTQMIKQSALPLMNLNLITEPGCWVNIKTDDATIFATLFYYYIPIGRSVVI